MTLAIFVMMVLSSAEQSAGYEYVSYALDSQRRGESRKRMLTLAELLDPDPTSDVLHDLVDGRTVQVVPDESKGKESARSDQMAREKSERQGAATDLERRRPSTKGRLGPWT